MESKEHKQIIAAINVLRRVTKFIKLVPFAYALIFILCTIGQSLYSIEASECIGLIFYVSPIVSLTFVWLSYPIKLCNWYRFQCCLPMFSIPFTLIDENVVEFSLKMAWISYAFLLLIFLLSLINAYFVFVRPKRTNVSL